MNDLEKKPELRKEMFSEEFTQEQYSQYWEMLRFHLSLSWQIPAVAVVAVIAFVGFSQDGINAWLTRPLLPAIAFLLLSIFLAVMVIHHRRNLLFVRKYERAIANLEDQYGTEVDVHHHRMSQEGLKSLERISSSKSLSLFLTILAIVLFGLSLYFFSLLA